MLTIPSTFFVCNLNHCIFPLVLFTSKLLENFFLQFEDFPMSRVAFQGTGVILPHQSILFPWQTSWFIYSQSMPLWKVFHLMESWNKRIYFFVYLGVLILVELFNEFKLPFPDNVNRIDRLTGTVDCFLPWKLYFFHLLVVHQSFLAWNMIEGSYVLKEVDLRCQKIII